MCIANICDTNVVSVTRETTIQEAACLMKKYNTAAVVVVDDIALGKKPCGIVTDRDIVTKILVNTKTLNNIQVGAAMSEEVLLLKHDEGIKQAIEAMSNKRVRHAPVVDNQGKVIGIFAIDDALRLLASEFFDLAKLITKPDATMVS